MGIGRSGRPQVGRRRTSPCLRPPFPCVKGTTGPRLERVSRCWAGPVERSAGRRSGTASGVHTSGMAQNSADPGRTKERISSKDVPSSEADRALPTIRRRRHGCVPTYDIPGFGPPDIGRDAGGRCDARTGSWGWRRSWWGCTWPRPWGFRPGSWTFRRDQPLLDSHSTHGVGGWPLATQSVHRRDRRSLRTTFPEARLRRFLDHMLGRPPRW